MCFSKESSMISYILGMILSTYLFLYGDRYEKMISIFCFTFIQMQLAEFLMWSDQACGEMNHFASIFTEFIIVFQPISILVGCLLYKTLWIPTEILILALSISILPLCMSIYFNIKNQKKLCSREIEKTGHLRWEYAESNSKYRYLEKNYNALEVEIHKRFTGSTDNNIFFIDDLTLVFL